MLRCVMHGKSEHGSAWQVRGTMMVDGRRTRLERCTIGSDTAKLIEQRRRDGSRHARAASLAVAHSAEGRCPPHLELDVYCNV